MSRKSKASEARVYFISAPSTGLVKIGWAVNPEHRLASIRLLSPVPLEMIGHAPGGEALERALHSTLAAHRAHGEWFRRSEDVDGLIAAILEGRVNLRPMPQPVPQARYMDLTELPESLKDDPTACALWAALQDSIEAHP